MSAYGAASESGKTFDGPGGKIYYEVTGTGSGIPLLVVNGGPGFDHTYLHIATAWDTLAKNRRVVFYDQRGDGRSDPLKPGQSCTLADQIADLEALRAHLGFDKIDLLGHSWGGYLSMAYAARHPEHIAHLLIVDFAMPGTNGAEVAVAARRKYPSLPILFVSGYSDSSVLEAAVGDATLLRKPFRPIELAAAVRSVLESSARPV